LLEFQINEERTLENATPTLALHFSIAAASPTQVFAVLFQRGRRKARNPLDGQSRLIAYLAKAAGARFSRSHSLRAEQKEARARVSLWQRETPGLSHVPRDETLGVQ
jgi:hypothetical protein